MTRERASKNKNKNNAVGGEQEEQAGGCGRCWSVRAATAFWELNEKKLLFERPFDKKRLTALDQRVGHTLFHKPTEDKKQRNRKKTVGTGDV